MKDRSRMLLEEPKEVHNPQVEKKGKERMSAVYEGKESDYISILADRPAHTINHSTEYIIREQFFSRAQPVPLR